MINIFMMFKAWIGFSGLVYLSCIQPINKANRPPTVVITIAPVEVGDSDSARFVWEGYDSDGRVAGYYYWLDDSTLKRWSDTNHITFHNLAFGPHLFGVQAVDDSGNRSLVAVAPFRVSYAGAIPALGRDSTLEIVTWNIQNFPKAGDTTLTQLELILSRLDIDIYCIQEIEDTLAFIRLLDRLNGYEGFYSRDDYGLSYQKTGVIFKPEMVEISDIHQIFWDNDSFPRPPLVMTVQARHNGKDFDFRLMILHLKAGSGYDDYRCRAGACRMLKGYLDTIIAAGAESDFVIVGDWNDQLDAPAGRNVFMPFLQDSLDYLFLTKPLAGNSYYASLVGGDVLFDHILVSADVLPEYTGGKTVTLRLDDYLVEYLKVISDHRPVMATFPVFQ